MISSYTEEDKEEFVSFIEKVGMSGDLNHVDELVENTKHFLLYKNPTIKGFAYSSTYNESEEETIDQVSVFVEPASRLKGIGSALSKEIEGMVYKNKPGFICAYMSVETENPIEFAQKMGYKRWWGSPELIYKGGAFPKSDFEFIPYEDKYFDRFVEVLQACYYELHKKNDMKPYIAPVESIKKYKLQNKDRVYLVLEHDQIVASVTLGNGEVDNVMVAPDYQGKGYGRKALQFSINKMLEEGFKEIRICYIEGNDHAEKLYTSIGFKPLHNTQVYRKFL